MRCTRSIGAVLAVVLFWSAAGQAATMSYRQIYAFGDSLSDVGNVYDLSGHALPVSPPYDSGRFSNGPVWVEDLADRLGQPAPTPSRLGGHDFAYGGAQTGTTLTHAGTGIDLNAQIDQFEARRAAVSDDTLFTLWIGSNDVNAFARSFQDGRVTLGDVGTFVGQASANVGDAVDRLAAAGLTHLLALDVPDLAQTPQAMAAASRTADPQATLNQIGLLTSIFNDALNDTLRDVAQRRGIDLTLIDTFDRIDDIVADPGLFGLDNVTEPCWTGDFTNPASGTVCDTPNDHLFWDGLHPTGAGHRLVADAAADALGLNAEPVPEPGNVLLFLLALLATAGVLARRHRIVTRTVS